MCYVASKVIFGPPDRDLSESAQARRRPPAIITCFEPRSEILHWGTKNTLPLQRLKERKRSQKIPKTLPRQMDLVGSGPLELTRVGLRWISLTFLRVFAPAPSSGAELRPPYIPLMRLM